MVSSCVLDLFSDLVSSFGCIHAPIGIDELLPATCWHDRPNWHDLARGQRPCLIESITSLGERTHGWQYHASSYLDDAEWLSLI